jgi:hypothetical protein
MILGVLQKFLFSNLTSDGDHQNHSDLVTYHAFLSVDDTMDRDRDRDLSLNVCHSEIARRNYETFFYSI